MRDDEIRQLLRDRNPWWRAAATGQDPTSWVDTDQTLAQAASVGITYQPTVLDDVAPPGLWILRGPRRVGKSVTAKRLLTKLCAGSDYDPAQLIYFSADGFRPQDLRRAFKLGRSLTDRIAPEPRIWVVDEITAVQSWVPVVKELRDNSPLASDAVILTGSSAADLDEARRALGAGRTRVTDPFRLLLPMSFRDYLAVTAHPAPAVEPLAPDQLQSPTARTMIRDLDPFVDELDLAWQQFLESGGFPRAVGDYQRIGNVSDEFVTDLLSWLESDIDPDGPTDSVPRLLTALHHRSTAPLDVSNTATDLGMTRERLRVRIARLKSTFAAFDCAQTDDRGRPISGARPKLYMLDPLLARLPALRDQTFPPPDMPTLTESQLALALGRAVDRIHPDRFAEQRSVMYLRTGGGNEVDFAALPIHRAGSEVRTVPIEAKWVSHNWRSQARVINGRYSAGILATKNVVDLDAEVWAVPAPIVALLLS